MNDSLKWCLYFMSLRFIKRATHKSHLPMIRATWRQFHMKSSCNYYMVNKLFVFTFNSVYKHTTPVKYDMKISFSKNSAAEEAWFNTAAVQETHFKPKCLFIFVEHKSWNFWRIICLLTTVHYCDYTWHASKIFKMLIFGAWQPMPFKSCITIWNK